MWKQIWVKEQKLAVCFDTLKFVKPLKQFKKICLKNVFFEWKEGKKVAKKLQNSFKKVSKKLKFSKDKRYKYVYLLLDPDLVKIIIEKQEVGVNEEELFELFIQAIIYVGKGFGIRAFEHDQIWIDRSDQVH